METRVLDLKKIGRVMDIAAVQCQTTYAEVDKMIDLVKTFHCVCASPMPFLTKYTLDHMQDAPEGSYVTGAVGFPSGAETIETKVLQTKENIRMGCREIDMVANVSSMLSGDYAYYAKDIKAVVDAAEGVPVKVIIEISYLNDEQIRRSSALCVKSGAAFVKMGTGWGSRPTTPEVVSLVKAEIGDGAKIKGAGGVRDLDTLIKIYEAGADRFGIGVSSAQKILLQAQERVR